MVEWLCLIKNDSISFQLHKYKKWKTLRLNEVDYQDNLIFFLVKSWGKGYFIKILTEI